MRENTPKLISGYSLGWETHGTLRACIMWAVVQEATSTKEVVSARTSCKYCFSAGLLCHFGRQRSPVLSQRGQPPSVYAATQRSVLQMQKNISTAFLHLTR